MNEELRNQLFEEAEYHANRYNQLCMLVLGCLSIVCIFLNSIGVFNVEPSVILLGCGLSVLFFIIPEIISIVVHCFFHGKFDAEQKSWFKYVIVICSFLGVLTANIVLTHHAVLLLAVPIFIMAQYRNMKHLIPIGIVLSTICVFAGVYMGYFYGLLDSNLVKVVNTVDGISVDLSIRKVLGTQQRMYELFTHYALPREMIILSLLLLASSISMRNSKILDKQAQLQDDVAKEMEHTNRMQTQVIEGMATLIENRDLSTGEHVKRTSAYVEIMTDVMKEKAIISEEEAEDMIKAAPLHDIGKIVISDRILQKPGKLTPEEYEEIKGHAGEGQKLVRNIFKYIEDEKFIDVATQISGYHHERWDGKGYPEGLEQGQIPLPARVMAIADVFDALISKRVYKEAYSLDEAFHIIEDGKGTQFDPELVRIFLSQKEKITKYVQTGTIM